MLALEAKRGVEATLERVFKATGNEFQTLVVAWTGTTAGIKTEGDTTYIMFPSIDETKPVSQTMFNELIGYALHELGHKWFTQDRPWDKARQLHGSYVSALINGLEDPRIEHFRAKAFVEAFDVRVLIRLAGLNEVDVNAVLSRPLLHRVRQEFRAVVAAELAWPTVDGTQLLEHGDDAHARQRHIDFDGERFAIPLVQDVEPAIGATRVERVAHEIHRPRVVQSRRRREREHVAFRQALLGASRLIEAQRAVHAVDALVIPRLS